MKGYENGMYRQGLHKPSAHTHTPVRTMHTFTAPHNRVKTTSTIPRGAPGRKSGTTIPKLGKKISVADILHMRYPK